MLCTRRLLACLITMAPGVAPADEATAPPAVNGPMTVSRLWTVVQRIDDQAEHQDNLMQFSVEDYQVLVVYDESADRMRIVIPIGDVSELGDGGLLRLLQANFDSALDARYAVARGTVWAVYIHPLSALDDREFLLAVGQTVNIVVTYGTSYSSGALVFGGGDSAALERRRLIERLLELGTST